ncbi:MAG: NAD(P)H-dependent oxidoreductase [Pseudomonadota bacterium]
MAISPLQVLRIDASARQTGSSTRTLTDRFLALLKDAGAVSRIVTRDLLDGLPLLDEAWVNANFTPPTERSADAQAALSFSDQLVTELEEADLIVLGAPIYNFGVPAALKAWIDQVARAGRTFQYTPERPEGLLKNKRAVIITASGGTKVGSDIDFATGYLRHVLGFMGITDVSLIAADQQMADAQQAQRDAQNDLSDVLAHIKRPLAG